MSQVFPRSFLYVPANRPDLFAKGARSGTDAVILDLEDAVPLAERATARAHVAGWLAGQDHGTAQPWVRLDPSSLADDLPAVAVDSLAGIVLAKADLAGLNELDRILGELSTPAADRLRVVGLIETASSFLGLADLVTHPRLVTLGIGEVDLLADLGMTLSPRTQETVNGMRARVAAHCAAAGLQPPVAPTSTQFRDLDGFAESSRLMHDLGFGSRTAIHPGQVAVIHDVLTPSPDEVEAAADVVARFEQADRGVALDAQGRLIDAAVVRQARRTLGRADVAHV